MVIVAVLVAAPLSLWSQDTGASLYKGKNCAICHGEKGEGKPAMKAPALAGTKLTAEKLVEFLTKGDKKLKGIHESPINELSADQAKLVADFVKAMK